MAATYFVLISLVLFLSTSYAGDGEKRPLVVQAPGPGCVDTLLAKSEGLAIENLPRISDLALPADVAAVIDKHPIQNVKKRFSPNNLEFLVQSFRDGYEPSTGEGVQSIFVKKTLERLMPWSRFPSRVNNPEFDDANLISRRSVRIDDCFERDCTGTKQLEMSILKSANPLYGAIDRNQTRNSLGLSTKARVLHIYSTSYYNDTGAGLEAKDRIDSIIEKAVKEGGPFDLVIYSDSGARRTDALKMQYGEAMTRFNWQPLSTVRKNEIEKLAGATKFVFNDTAGKMPFLHAVSDLVVVVGPINFFEPLSVGSRTILLNNSDLNPYPRREFRDMTKKAEDVPYFEFIERSEDLSMAIQNVKAVKPQSRYQPWLTANPSGKTPLVEYLDHLYENLK